MMPPASFGAACTAPRRARGAEIVREQPLQAIVRVRADAPRSVPCARRRRRPRRSRTARCSSITPRYCTGIDQPANGTMRAPRDTWRACSGVSRRVAVTGAEDTRRAPRDQSSSSTGWAWRRRCDRHHVPDHGVREECEAARDRGRPGAVQEVRDEHDGQRQRERERGHPRDAQHRARPRRGTPSGPGGTGSGAGSTVRAAAPRRAPRTAAR